MLEEVTLTAHSERGAAILDREEAPFPVSRRLVSRHERVYVLLSSDAEPGAIAGILGDTLEAIDPVWREHIALEVREASVSPVVELGRRFEVLPNRTGLGELMNAIRMATDQTLTEEGMADLGLALALELRDGRKVRGEVVGFTLSGPGLDDEWVEVRPLGSENFERVEFADIRAFSLNEI